MDEMIKAATEAVIGALTKAAAEPALAAGGKVWHWLKGRLTGDEARLAADIEAELAKPSASSKVTALLQDALHENPAAVAQLRELLNAAGGMAAITQTANFIGNNNKNPQTAGNYNTTHIG